MNVPMPQPIEVASCRTVRELLELLGSLVVEADEPDAVTVDDWAHFRAGCHDRLPETHAEWIDTIPFAAVRAEAERQLREGEPQAAAVVRNESVWSRRAVEGSHYVADDDTDTMPERRRLIDVLLGRRRAADGIDRQVSDELEELRRLLESPPGGLDAHPAFWREDRKHDGKRGTRPRWEPQPKLAEGPRKNDMGT